MTVRLEHDPAQLHPTDTFRPTILMQQVSDELSRSRDPIPIATLRALIHPSKPKLLDEAVARLLVEGYITEVRWPPPSSRAPARAPAAPAAHPPRPRRAPAPSPPRREP